MQQLRFLFIMALLYMFRVTISPIIRSTMLYTATGELAHLDCPAGSTTQNNKTEITYNSTAIELLYY